MGDLRHAYIQMYVLKHTPYAPWMDDAPAREWASEELIEAASRRFAEFGHLLTGEIDEFLKIEDKSDE